MKNFSIILCIFLIFSARAMQSQEEADGPACLDCHGDLVKKTVMHYPAEDACDNCHMSNGEVHPQEGVLGFELEDEMPALCFMCHEGYTKANVHAPAAMGECLMCHSPHASEEPGLLLQANTEQFCGDCHDLAMLGKKVRHEALELGGCGACHAVHESDHSFLLQYEKKELCMECHDQVRKEWDLELKHYPFEDDCAYCHESHSSDFASLLLQQSPALCFDCHETGSLIESSALVHRVVLEGKNCSHCHSPHASSRSGLLLKRERDLCLACHNRPVETGERTLAGIGRMLGPGKVTHGVFTDGACSACHASHASDHVSLLKGNFPSGLYAPSGPEQFALCFECHDPALMEEDSTTTSTGFRDGERNLHFLHMSGGKARSCKLCHNVHGSPNPSLIAEMVPFGNWDMPMAFVREEHGGSCSTGCHGKLSYSRQ